MTEREKLTELIKNSNALARCGCHYNDIDFYAKQLADYLLANGVVVPPCDELLSLMPYDENEYKSYDEYLEIRDILLGF